MTDDTSRDPSRHQTLRAFRARGNNPADHPNAAALAEVAGRDRWLAREHHRREAAARVEAGTAEPIDRWTIELLDDDALADWFIEGLPDDLVVLEERRTMEAWDLEHRPWAAEVVVLWEGYRCDISGRTDSAVALRLTPRLEEDARPILLHPDEVAVTCARGMQVLEEALDLTVAMGPLRRRRIVDERLADSAMRTPPVVQHRPPEA